MDIKIGNGNSLSIVNGDLQATEGFAESVRQKLLIRLRTFRGEWVFNVAFGPPYLENENNSIQLFGISDEAIFSSFLRESILSEEGVSSINSFRASVDRVTKTLSILTSIRLIDESNLTLEESINI